MKKISILLTLVLFISIFFTPLLKAAPSGSIYLDEVSADNFLTVDEVRSVTIVFFNTADIPSGSDVPSTVQYLAVAAAVRNPSLVDISTSASWEIREPDDSTVRASGSDNADKTTSQFIPPGPPTTPAEQVDLYTWELGPPSASLNAYTDPSQFTADTTLKILRPKEFLYLTIDITCKGAGDSVIWFLFRATEDEHESVDTYPQDISSVIDKRNIYYSKLPGPPTNPTYWLPLHNSYDPYDDDISSGHSFEQTSWDQITTNTQYAKTNKIVHQAPKDGDGIKAIFHICGLKFEDANRNGNFEEESEAVIDNVTIALLGADALTPAEEFYQGIEYSLDTTNPVFSGSKGLSGSYCFNVLIREAGTYTFYVKEEVPSGFEPTIPSIRGPIVFTAEEDPQEIDQFDINNVFGNARRRARERDPRLSYVGGKLSTVNKSLILTPYLVLVGLGFLFTVYVTEKIKAR